MRAFLGTPVAATSPLRSLLKDLAGCGADLKVVAPENLHVTYKFLGDIERGQVASILDAVRSAGLPPPFDVEIRDAGAFPDWNRLNVLWAGLDDADGMLAQLATSVEGALASMGWPREERAFRPHLTLARKRGREGLEAARRVLEAARDKPLGTFEVRDVRLFESTLTPSGPVYETAGRIEL